LIVFPEKAHGADDWFPWQRHRPARLDVGQRACARGGGCRRARGTCGVCAGRDGDREEPCEP